MLQNPVFIGVDVSAAALPYSFAVLDSLNHLVVLKSGQLEDLISTMTGLEAVVITINAPSSLNMGLFSNTEMRQRYLPSLEIHRRPMMRLCEYELIRRGISNVPHTSNELVHCPAWVKNGFDLYHRLSQMGFQPFTDHGICSYQYMETYADACFWVFSNQGLLKSRTLEGRLQRQLLLYDLGVPVADAMVFFEELTRHRLVKGILPLDCIHSPGELNALMSAYMARSAVNFPGKVTWVGAVEEGLIIIPNSTETTLPRDRSTGII
jgi:hypothetical protein